jgi:hypothetical protein
MNARFWFTAAALSACMLGGTARAGSTFFFSTGNPDGLMATAARAPNSQIESADDFVTTAPTTLITSATFTGLITGGVPLSNITEVNIDLYHVFPVDSGPPSGNVPTRVNSPSDTEFTGKNSIAGDLTFTPGIINSSFTAANSVLNGIFPKPGFHTGGEGPVTGQEVTFNVLFKTPFALPADHYFFVPTVAVTGGEFFWLSAPRPIVPPGTPFPPGFTDLQEWVRNTALDPDWLRVGQDIVGGNPFPTFNATFTLSGSAVPEPSSVIMLSLGGVCVVGGLAVRKRCAKQH